MSVMRAPVVSSKPVSGDRDTMSDQNSLQKYDFRRDFLILATLVLMILGAVLTPAKKWLLWSGEQRVVESHIRSTITPGEEWEIVSWQPPRSLSGTPGADRAIWCHYTTQKTRDKLRRTKAIFYLQNGRVRKVLQSDDPLYVDSYKAQWGEPASLADILVPDDVIRPGAPPTMKPVEPNWDEPPNGIRLDLCLLLINKWQRRANITDLPTIDKLQEYLKDLPLSELVSLGTFGQCFLDREVLKREWEERGKTNAWMHPTFLRREDVLVSATDKHPFEIRKEIIVDSQGLIHHTLARESEGTEQKQPGGLGPVRLVWIGGVIAGVSAGAQLITLPGNRSEWKVSVDTGPLIEYAPPPPQVQQPQEMPQPQQRPVEGPSPLRMIEFAATGVKRDNVQLKGQVINHSDSIVKNARIQFATAQGLVSVRVTPSVLGPGEVGSFSRQVRRGLPGERFPYEI